MEIEIEDDDLSTLILKHLLLSFDLSTSHFTITLDFNLRDTVTEEFIL